MFQGFNSLMVLFFRNTKKYFQSNWGKMFLPKFGTNFAPNGLASKADMLLLY